MVVIDGSHHSGSGTIVRYAVALAALLREPIRIINVRHSRTQPGLRPQHVASVRACAQLSGAVTDGVQVDSREFTFTPGGFRAVPSSGTSGRPGPRRCWPSACCLSRASPTARFARASRVASFRTSHRHHIERCWRRCCDAWVSRSTSRSCGRGTSPEVQAFFRSR
jgi:hypothetical protein